MTIGRPAVKVTVDGRALTGPEAALAGLRAELAMGSAHDRVVLAVSPLSPLADVAPGAALELASGYGDTLTDVFSGVVTAVEWIAGGVAIEALARTIALSQAFVAQPYLQQSVADIVRDLLGRASVDAGQIEAPLSLHVYHVDERRAVWDHLQDLSRVASCDLHADAAGALCFQPARTGPADHTLRYGAELLAWSFGRRDQGAAPPAIAPYGAASESGADAWHFVVQEPSQARTAWVHAALRDRDGAQALSRGLTAARTRRGIGGELVAVGDPSVRPGDLVDVADLPNGDPGTLRALAVSHAIDATHGFVTRIRVEAS